MTNQPYYPSHQEIQAKCREIQATWSPKEKEKRNNHPIDPVTILLLEIIENTPEEDYLYSYPEYW